MNDNEMRENLTFFLKSKGVADVGFCNVEGEALPCAVSIVVPLSEAIVSEIKDAPTHTYFNHYRTVNAFIDRTLLEAGLFLQAEGYRYITVAASQSINLNGNSFAGRVSHKMIACAAGLGTMGMNNLFIHNTFGPAVRLGTVLTDLTPGRENSPKCCGCDSCRLCADKCPAKAISFGENGEAVFKPALCSEYMKREFQLIGRGAVCGICMACCPKMKK